MAFLFVLVEAVFLFFILPFGAAAIIGRIRSKWPDGRLLVISSSIVPAMVFAFAVVAGLDLAWSGSDGALRGTSMVSIVQGLLELFKIGMIGGGLGLFAGIMALMFRKVP